MGRRCFYPYRVLSIRSDLSGVRRFRFENGKVVEHWDNLEPSTGPNASGRTQTDGPLVPKDHDKTDANKALVRSFVEDVLVNGQLDRLTGFFDGDSYIQHNPKVADGVSGFLAAADTLAKAGKRPNYTKIHMLLGEGDFVFTASEGSVGDAPTSFFDLFRVENGKIAEHWDTVATIPDRSSWKNANGKV